MLLDLSGLGEAPVGHDEASDHWPDESRGLDRSSTGLAAEYFAIGDEVAMERCGELYRQLALSPAASPAMADFSPAERARLMQSKIDYREFYARLKDIPLAISRETGVLLYMLARSCKARTIVEFGTSFGISTLHLAAALRDNGGGHLISSEFEPSKVARARANLAAGGLADLVEIRVGDALQTLSVGLPEPIDLLLLDGAKALYPEILSLVESRLRPGALIVADNADDSPDYLARVRAPAEGYLSTRFADDVELSLRIG